MSCECKLEKPVLRGVVEKELTCVYKKPSFWARLKYLFTGRHPVVVHPNDILKELGGATPPDSKKYLASYTTFAGCDIKIIATFGLDENPTLDDLLSASVPCYKKPISKLRETERYVKEHSRVIGEAQAISVREVVEHDNGTEGTLLCVLFGESVMNKINKISTPIHLVLRASTEYGDSYFMALPNFRVTEWSWAIAIDDLVSEENLRFRCDRPIYWKRIVQKRWDETGQIIPNVE